MQQTTIEKITDYMVDYQIANLDKGIIVSLENLDKYERYIDFEYRHCLNIVNGMGLVRIIKDLNPDIQNRIMLRYQNKRDNYVIDHQGNLPHNNEYTMSATYFQLLVLMLNLHLLEG
ncbi:MAG: hypothetical protein INQ03_09365 [Candidatus Heimdallarchaeota archaeon]|nr:hypothetical protein [Candidatus Heimdallarchaeota archaeon]